MNHDKLLWEPAEDQISESPIMKFIEFVGRRVKKTFIGYDDLYDWSVDEKEDFWDALWDFCGVVGEKGSKVLEDGDDIEKARWFPDARLN